MATESNNPLHETLAESEKLLKEGEKELARIGKLRKEIGLKEGASKEFLEHIPGSNDKRQKAEKELSEFLKNSEDITTEKGNKSKQKKRSKLTKAMNRKLRI
ncbi:hypothetical protein M3P05_09550 [Sansalvadorimonas sp. 2012CJ34-2]|uniref:Uncharacterized protein n=1 Tax=Parendozoicomonas callyspongiae TaxID=2942213 RepID=A0ABT0PFM8_9GAMM|nr:hypothetical protein [Sansalvadorimonas sp. 2012CJ34-2]MCL6270177.1 hypothetical protein [Sansalvadorimonas sp. 2012CJ34-2]